MFNLHTNDLKHFLKTISAYIKSADLVFKLKKSINKSRETSVLNNQQYLMLNWNYFHILSIMSVIIS